MGISKRSLGINFNKKNQAVIKVWAPKASRVTVRSGNNKVTLKKEGYGYWSAITGQISAGSSYWFILDDEKQLPDPASLSQPDGVHEASVALDLNCYWQDEHWTNIPLKDYIFYELHVGTFTPEGNFKGVAAHLDHLLGLGITAIEMMPVAAFPGTRNWGYDVVIPFAVQTSYGGADGLQSLVNLCHQKGLAVVLDVVYNHVGPEGNYFDEYGAYFTDKYQTPWGAAFNYDDRDCDAVRDFVVENVLMWFRDFHIDALRLDAVHAIKDFSAVHLLEEIRTKTDELMAATGRTHYLIAEDPQDEATFRACKLNWKLLNMSGHHQIFLYYKQLIALRKKYMALSAGDRNACCVSAFTEKNCLLLERGITGSKELVLCFMNFSTAEHSLIVPGYLQHLKKITDSADPRWHGLKAAPDQVHADQQLTIQPESFIAYSAEYV